MKTIAKMVLTLCWPCVCAAALNTAAAQAAEHFVLTIQGDGYFQATDPATGEILYTRVGNISINENGQFVAGDPSADRELDPAITIPPTAISVGIAADGLVSIVEAGSTTTRTLNSIQLVRFDNPQGLSSRGDNLFSQTKASGQPTQGVPGTNGLGSIQPVRWKLRTSSNSRN